MSKFDNSFQILVLEKKSLNTTNHKFIKYDTTNNIFTKSQNDRKEIIQFKEELTTESFPLIEYSNPSNSQEQQIPFVSFKDIVNSKINNDIISIDDISIAPGWVEI